MRTHNATDRIEYIDIAKGILIILVVIGHLLKGSTIISIAMIRVINAFHMPAFFIISGMLTNTTKYHQMGFEKYMRNRFVRLMIPYVLFEIIGGLWQMLLLGTSAVNIVGIISGILTVRCHVGANWFLVTLFFAELIVYLLSKVNKKEIRWIMIVAAFLTAFFLPEKNYLLANCRRICVSVGFILIGMCFKQYFMSVSRLMFAISSIGLVVGAAINSETVSIALRLFGHPILFVFCGIAGTYATIIVAKRFVKYDRLRKPFVQCGKASLIIMGTHQNVLIPFNILYGNWTSLEIKLSVLVITIVVEVLLILIAKKFLPSWVGN